MNVFVDGLIFEVPWGFGIWRVFYEIMGRLNGGGVQQTLWLRGEPKKALPEGVEVLQDTTRADIGRWDLPRRARRKWSMRDARKIAQRAEVFHSTYFTPPPTPDAAVVVTVHDLVPEKLFSICGPWCVEHIARRREALRSATACIAVSAATAADVALFYPEVADRIRVVHHGCDHLSPPKDRVNTAVDSARGGSGFVLYVGEREAYKNFHMLLESMRSAAWPRRVKLHVVGPPLLDRESRLIEVYGLGDRIRSFAGISDNELQEQYSAAQCFVYPSLMEGFGLPVLEAQTNGCPVLLSDIPAFREVAGDSALFFDPRLGERLAEAVAQTCDRRLCRRLVDAGRENLKRFSWQKAAEQTKAVYEEAVRLGRANVPQE